MEEKKKDNSDAPVKPDEETLHTTDPQENMQGPVSSFMQEVKENMEDKSGEKKNTEETT